MNIDDFSTAFRSSSATSEKETGRIAGGVIDTIGILYS